MPLPTYDAAIAKFMTILGPGFSLSDTRQLVEKLQASNDLNELVFEDMVYKLRTKNILSRVEENYSREELEQLVARRRLEDMPVKNSPNTPPTNLSRPLAPGGYGVIFKSPKMIYKYIYPDPDDDDTDTWARTTFLEAWLQTVLGLDDTYGKCISQITGLYRSSSTVRRTGVPYIRLYITMDIIPNNFFTMTQVLQNQSPTKDLVTLKQIGPVFAEMAKVLNYFRIRYSFYHRDFHSGNIMFTETLEPRIIDFGMCCMKFDGNFYSMPDKYYTDNLVLQYLGSTGRAPAAAECFSFDLLQFLTSVFEFAANNASLSSEVMLFIYLLMSSRDGRTQLYRELVKLRDERYPDAAVFHLTYPYSWGKKSRGIVPKLLAVPTILLPNFIMACEDSANFMAARADFIKVLRMLREPYLVDMLGRTPIGQREEIAKASVVSKNNFFGFADLLSLIGLRHRAKLGKKVVDARGGTRRSRQRRGRGLTRKR
jgi:serine/threonine protein kinase